MKNNHRIKRKIIVVVMVLILITSSLLTSCHNSETVATTVTSVQSQSVEKVSLEIDAATALSDRSQTVETDYDSDDLQTDFDTDEIATIIFSDQKIEYSGSNAIVSGSKITILSSGVYTISGNMENGQIVIDSQNNGTVFILLNGVDLNCVDSAPIYIVNADKTVVSLVEETQNYLSDGTNYILSDIEDQEPNATLFSEDDLTINGSGSLTIDANYKHGINCKDDLVIVSGNITINAASDGIRGRDSITVADGNINIIADNDGMQSNNDNDKEKGYILVSNGIINISSGNDGIQAETDVTITNGIISILAGGGTQNIVVAEMIHENEKDSMIVIEETESTKGIKAGSSLVITGGNIDVDSHDDSLHGNDTLYISAGNITLSTDDDGIHADNDITIDGGSINVLNCNEAIESMVITINDGEIRLNASDDGFNATGGTASAMGMKAAPGMEVSNPDCILNINGGYIVVNSNGDSIDSNGNIFMTNGVIIANGPLSSTNGALDSDGEFYIGGGLLIAVGSSGMAESPDAISDQYSVLYLYDTLQDASTIIYIEAETGEQILAYETSREYQSIAFSSPELEKGVTYNIYSVTSMDSTNTDGVYEKGTYSNGTLIGQFTISSSLTVIGTQSRQSPGGIKHPGGAGGAAGRRP